MKKLFRKFFPARNRRGHRLGKWLAFHRQAAGCQLKTRQPQL